MQLTDAAAAPAAAPPPPPSPMSAADAPVFALALHGKLGTWQQSASGLDKMETHGQPNIFQDSLDQMMAVASFAHEQFRRHLIEPNMRQGVTVRCFLHSWNPEAAGRLNALYDAYAGRHEPSPPRQGTSATVLSQHLSMLRVLQLVNASRPLPQMVFVSRFDLLLFADLQFPPLLDADLWLPNHCINALGLQRNASQAVSETCGCISNGKNACGSNRGLALVPPRASRYISYRARSMGPVGDHNSFVLDYFFIATVPVALSFTDIYTNHSEYTNLIHKQLLWKAVSSWSHFFWTAHINFFLPSSVTVRFGPLLHTRDFQLVRFYPSGLE